MLVAVGTPCRVFPQALNFGELPARSASALQHPTRGPRAVLGDLNVSKAPAPTRGCSEHLCLRIACSWLVPATSKGD